MRLRLVRVSAEIWPAIIWSLDWNKDSPHIKIYFKIKGTRLYLAKYTSTPDLKKNTLKITGNKQEVSFYYRFEKSKTINFIKIKWKLDIFTSSNSVAIL